MKTLRFVAALCAAASLTATPNVLAQATAPTAPIQSVADAKKFRVIEVKNAPAALLAYQLDPTHNPLPAMLGIPKTTFFGTRKGNTVIDNPEVKRTDKGAFDLPGDIEQIVSVDPQNVLLVKGGSDQDFRRLMELVDVLDQPLRQVEIEAQFVEVSLEDARQFGIDFSTDDAAKMEGAPQQMRAIPQVGFVRDNFVAKLNALIADNRAKIITAPRVTAINNLTVSLGSAESRTRVSKETGELEFLSSGVSLQVTPTINGDDTVTLLLTPTAKGEGAKVPGLETIANVRDGDTIVLGGLSPLFARADNPNPPNVIVFLTARIIRRAKTAPTQTKN